MSTASVNTLSTSPHQPLTPATTARPSAAAMLSIGGRQLLVALRVLLLMTVILGIGYPLVILGASQALAPTSANGSMITDSTGTVVGSALIGQQFDDPKFFTGRPSAAGDGYDAMASSGSNLAADSPELLAQVQERRAVIAAADGVAPADVPPDALTASGSGLDPDISPAYAQIQVNRVAAARGISVEQVQTLVEEHTSGRALGFIGEERVNVVELNLALEQLTGSTGT